MIGDKREDAEATELLQWLCGSWRDQKGSTYEVFITEAGTVCLSTTRPSGAVLNSKGLIHEADGRVVWGRPGQRHMYTLEKSHESVLRWRSSNEHGNAFDWTRQDSNESASDDAADEEQRAVRGERRAQLRREYQNCRANGQAIKQLIGVGVGGKGNVPGDAEVGIEGKVVEILTTAAPPAKAAPPPPAPTTFQQWHDMQSFQNFHLLSPLGIWNPMHHTDYFAQTPVPGMPPPVWNSPYLSTVPIPPTPPLGKVQ